MGNFPGREDSLGRRDQHRRRVEDERDALGEVVQPGWIVESRFSLCLSLSWRLSSRWGEQIQYFYTIFLPPK